ncbi:hypothetical protein [Parafrankia sp. EUN1f]|uniref:hypothetical protein n=1 Tax=Parafrankia sp. EUN1f TaxID=102897 RepID=UPI0001C44E08|nr:hypothetical protein [Parafrankia sp. EUN1f]EFC84059.1 hypothetical protein FrEUN1fDRAFT_2785 [Parafrankia sp. EUN1f]
MSRSPDVTGPSSPAGTPPRGPARRSILTAPRPLVVTAALDIARRWCSGHQIDGAPALGHAVRVALALGRHLPDVSPSLTAAILLHDVPDYADTQTLGIEIGDRCGTDVLIALWLIHGEHTAMDLYQHDPDAAVRRLETLPSDVAAALAADKVVSLSYVLGCARRAWDIRSYWASRRAFLTLVPYFRAFVEVTAPRLPPALADELGGLVRDARRAAILAAPVTATGRVAQARPRQRILEGGRSQPVAIVDPL